MSEAHVPMFDVVLLIRLLDMQNMCLSLVAQSKERGKDKMARRLDRAAQAFKDMAGEVSVSNRQMTLDGGG